MCIKLKMENWNFQEQVMIVVILCFSLTASNWSDIASEAQDRKKGIYFNHVRTAEQQMMVQHSHTTKLFAER